VSAAARASLLLWTDTGDRLDIGLGCDAPSTNQLVVTIDYTWKPARNSDGVSSERLTRWDLAVLVRQRPFVRSRIRSDGTTVPFSTSPAPRTTMRVIARPIPVRGAGRYMAVRGSSGNANTTRIDFSARTTARHPGFPPGTCRAARRRRAPAPHTPANAFRLDGSSTSGP
jgi:hypothetical protein